MINKYGDITPRTAAYAVAKILTNGQFSMVTERFGQVDTQPKNSTKTRKYRRYLPLARASAPLAEGIPPEGKALAYEDISVTLEQLGDLVNLSDVVMDTHEDKVLMATMGLVGDQIGESLEEFRLNTLKAGTNVYYANSVATRALVTSPATRGDLRKIERAFARNKAKTIKEIISATPNVATEPVASAFFCLGHTDCKADIEDLTGFTAVEKYSQVTKALPDEIGKVGAIRFILTGMVDPWLAAGVSGSTYLTNSASGTGEADVYPLLVIAKDAYAIVPLQGENAVTPMVHNPSPVIGDPLAQNGFVSWKTMQGCVILQQLYMARLEVAATANPS